MASSRLTQTRKEHDVSASGRNFKTTFQKWSCRGWHCRVTSLQPFSRLSQAHKVGFAQVLNYQHSEKAKGRRLSGARQFVDFEKVRIRFLRIPRECVCSFFRWFCSNTTFFGPS